MLSLSVPQTIFTCEGQWILTFVTHLLLALGFFFVFVIGDIFLCCISFIEQEDKLKYMYFMHLQELIEWDFQAKKKSYIWNHFVWKIC